MSEEDKQVRKGVASVNWLIRCAAERTGALGYMVANVTMTIIFIIIMVANVCFGTLLAFLIAFLAGAVGGYLGLKFISHFTKQICEDYYIKLDEEDKEEK